MEKVILVGGKAGQGVAATAKLIGKVFSGLGYYVFNYRDYPSLIRGGHNFNVVRISDKPIYSHSYKYDLILALDQETIKIHLKDLRKGGIILGNKSLDGKNINTINIAEILGRLKASRVIGNDVFIGWMFKYFGVNKVFLFSKVNQIFRQKKSVVINKAIKEGYKIAKQKEKIRKIGKSRYFISGSKAVGIGAINGGLDVYVAYPMTPATPVLHFLAKRQFDNNYLVLQLENEIGVISAALGASFAGARSMVGTSGGGFALMAESLSLAGISEVPLVVYLAQRTGPATGIPTYNTQGDLKFVLNAGQGEFPRIVVAPGDPQEAIARTQEVFYLSAKYRILSILLSDKHLAESNYTFENLKKSNVSISKFLLEKPGKDYKSYRLTKTGFSQRAVPGQGPIVRGTSYEHDEYGNTVEGTEWAIKMTDKRFRKMESIQREVSKFDPVKVYGSGKNLIIGWGSTKGAIIDALASVKGYRFLQVSYISPFPEKEVLGEIRKSDRVVLVENNATGLLGHVIAEQTGHIIKRKILKYDGRPFIAEDIIKKL